ncbi:MAG: 2-C-methyl-D-erythritol 2,4-cyclodiphosphate synthase [Lachnospiraceae bacterium]|nr:2-C-methyl-D-erythritol 2,4-cyclodiphosphate synthase [Lachnospiraceae bacterium]
MRIGTGYDVHRLVEGRELILGGVKIPCERGLLGHSDADVLVHAVMDALLGAAALGDIGRHFPDSDESYRGISSLKLLEQVGALLQKEHYLVGNIDATIIAQRPKLAPFIELMRDNIAAVLGISRDQVNVKATTEEGLGFTGAGEGIAAQAVALLCSAADYLESGNAGVVYASDENGRESGCAGGKCGYCRKCGEPEEVPQEGCR